MKRFLIHVNTNWCGMNDTFRAEAKSEMELDDIAEQLAYNNFQSYDIDSEFLGLINKDVGVDNNNYAPISYREVKSKIKFQKTKFEHLISNGTL